MKNLYILLCLCSFNVGAESLGEKDIDSNLEYKVIIADKLDWENYPAYFVYSKDRGFNPLLREFKIQKQNRCSIKALWFCNDNINIYQGVSGRGTKTSGGYICSSKAGIPSQKFYAERLLSVSPCIEFEKDDEDHKYYIDWP